MGGSGAILIVDDDSGLRETLEEFLRLEGFRVVCARDGAEGLARLAEVRPDVILCDLTMPVMGGREFLARLRADRVHSGIPVVLMSGTEEIPRAGARADLVVGKPFELDELVDAVRRLARRRSGAEA